MTDVFKEYFKTKMFKQSGEFLKLWQPEFIKNPDRRWWQFWKPMKIKNPAYDPRPVEIDIVRKKEVITW